MADFQGIIQYFSERLNLALISSEERAELRIDHWKVTFSKGKDTEIKILLGTPQEEISLKDLLRAHFLGIETRGATFSLDKERNLFLKMELFLEPPLASNWDTFLKAMEVAHYWKSVLKEKNII